MSTLDELAKLNRQEAVHMGKLEQCPHISRPDDGPDICDLDSHVCILECTNSSCDMWEDIKAEWQESTMKGEE